MQMTMIEALNLGLTQELERDKRVVVFGEDIGPNGGVFRVTEGLQKKYGELRVFDTPLAESGIIGTAVGMAVHTLHAQGKPPVYMVAMNEVTDAEGYRKEYLPTAQKTLKEHGGVYVAAGDFTGSGLASVITGPGLSGGPHVRVFNALSGAVEANLTRGANR